MTESSVLLDVDNDTLLREYEFYRNVGPKSQRPELREEFLQEIRKIYDSADKNHDGMIQRSEFDNLIRGYFDIKSIKPTKENYDWFFEKIDKDHSHSISIDEFVSFMDDVNENDILPFITEELQNRGLL